MSVVQADFTKPTLNANPCNFSFKLPSFTFGFNLPAIPFPPFFIPIPRFRLAISCDLSQPVKLDAGIDYGGGRQSKNFLSPDDDDSF